MSVSETDFCLLEPRLCSRAAGPEEQCGAGRWRLIRNTRRCRASISAADVTSEAPRVEGVFSPTSFGRQRIEIMSDQNAKNTRLL